MQFPKLRPFQDEAYASLVRYSHTLLIAPTGSGKSLIFQKYLLENKKHLRTIMISPLNALARQQAQKLKDLGLNVKVGVGFHAEGPPAGAGVWVMNPERIKAGLKNDPLKNWKPDFLIVDEAHCIWEWGDGFRPEFKKVLHLVHDYKIKKSFWCTATLPREARGEILRTIPGGFCELGQFSLPSTLKIYRKQSTHSTRILELKKITLSLKNESGIIFVCTRNSAENLAKYFHQWGMQASIYHAGMSQEERVSLENSLNKKQNQGESVMLIVTSAFGMGMDYAFFKYCILFEPPFNLLSLAQSLGRVGRSGAVAQAWVFWHEDDFLRYGWMTKGEAHREAELNWVRRWCKEGREANDLLDEYFNAHESSC